MKKLISSSFIAVACTGMVACNSGSSTSGDGLALSANTNQCTYSSTINTSITYTIKGTVPGHEYAILAKNIWSGQGQNNPVTNNVTAESNSLTIVATCDYPQFPVIPASATSDMTASTDAFAIDITAASSSDSLVQSNLLQYTVSYVAN